MYLQTLIGFYLLWAKNLWAMYSILYIYFLVPNFRDIFRGWEERTMTTNNIPHYECQT